MTFSQSSDFIFRVAEERDRGPFLNLARLAFMPMTALADMEQEMNDLPINPIGRKGWVVEDGTGTLVARYRHLELTQYFLGVPFPMAGVGSVAVAIERRAQGAAQWMLQQALREFRDCAIPLSMLYPFRQSFYRKLGWAAVGVTHQYRVSSRSLPLYPERSHMAAYDLSQELSLVRLYATLAREQNGWLQREAWWWEGFFKPKPGREIYIYLENNTLLGYIVLEFAKLEPAKDQLAVIVREWVAQTSTAYRGIVGFLASLQDQVTTIVWNGNSDDPFPYLLKERQHDPALTLPHFQFNYLKLFGMISGGFMWRLVNPSAAIVQRPIQPVPPFQLRFQIYDPVFGQDEFTVEFGDGRMQLTPTPAATVLKMSVDQLAQLFCGLRRSCQLHWTGELELEGDATLLTQLDAAWSTQPLFCWDAF